MTSDGAREVLNVRSAQAGLDGVHPHRFRHTFAHRWLAGGGQERDLMMLAGWRSDDMLSRYAASIAVERARGAPPTRPRGQAVGAQLRRPELRAFADARANRNMCAVSDEVGYIPFEPEAANLFFQLVSSRYERASLIVTSNKPFGRWGEVFGDEIVAAAMIDRLVHHAEVIALKGDSYRLKDRDLGRTTPTNTDD
jgi:hypothetical protein